MIIIHERKQITQLSIGILAEIRIDQNNGHTQDSIYTAIIFGVICNLSILSEDDLSSSSDHTQLGDIDLNHGTFSKNAELRVHG